MKKYKKKLLSMAVAFLSAFSFFNVPAYAEQENLARTICEVLYPNDKYGLGYCVCN